MIRHIAVVVPAADEESRIAGCLRGLAAASRTLAAVHPDVGVEVVVALDDCRDGTADIVAAEGGARCVVSTARCVGVARAIGTDAALAGRVVPEVWTAHTDADSQVPADWLVHMVDAAARGVDVVLGTVVPSAELPGPTLRAWHRLHRPGDGHRNVHGANLGIRASALRAVGGWRPLPTGEDVDLAARAEASGLLIERTGAVPVRTSARVSGRAPEGFSSYLRTLAARRPEPVRP